MQTRDAPSVAVEPVDEWRRSTNAPSGSTLLRVYIGGVNATQKFKKKVQTTADARATHDDAQRERDDAPTVHRRMNSPQRALKRQREQEARTVTSEAAKDAARVATLKALKLKTVVRESHGASATTHCEYAHGTSKCSNLFATCGGELVTIYDDEHFGDHVSVVAQYANASDERQRGGRVTSVAWVSSGYGDAKTMAVTGRGGDGKENVNGTSNKKTKAPAKTKTAKASAAPETESRRETHEFGDAVLAVGDEHGVISVISVAGNRVVARLHAHEGAVIDLSGACAKDGFLVSLGADGVMKTWDVFGGEDGEGECVGTYVARDGACVACKADGSGAVTGHKGGVVKDWTFAAAAPTTLAFKVSFGPKHDVDCVRVVNDVVFAKTTNMCFGTFDLKRNESLHSWEAPNKHHRAKARLDPTRFGVTSDGAFLACGDAVSTGIVYTYDARTGELVSELEPLRVTGVVRAAHVSDHCRHVLASYGPGVVWRYEIIPAVVDDLDHTA